MVGLRAATGTVAFIYKPTWQQMFAFCFRFLFFLQPWVPFYTTFFWTPEEVGDTHVLPWLFNLSASSLRAINDPALNPTAHIAQYLAFRVAFPVAELRQHGAARIQRFIVCCWPSQNSFLAHSISECFRKQLTACHTYSTALCKSFTGASMPFTKSNT